MYLSDLHSDDVSRIQQAAAVLVAGFQAHFPHAWPDLAAALAEVQAALAPEKICRVAREQDGTVIGWIGGNPQYGGCVWELHPLVVRPDVQGRGIGRAGAQRL
jgi:aminoglycoside 6'-N-acetyltransferase I